MADIKKKPDGVKIKTKDSIKSSTVSGKRLYPKDAKLKKLLREKEEQRENKKADTEAAETVESAAETMVDKIRSGSRAVVENRIRKHKRNQIKKKEEYLKAQAEKADIPEQATLPEPKTPKETMRESARREYVKDKLQIKRKEEYTKIEEPRTSVEPPKAEQSKIKTKTDTHKRADIKTRQKYAEASRVNQSSNQRQRVKTPLRSRVVKTRENISDRKKHRVKTGNAYSDTAKKTKVVYKKNPATKTTKEVVKRANKEAAKRAAKATREAAKRAVQAAEKAAKATAKATQAIVTKTIQLLVAAAKAIASAIAALGWWALVILVVIIIICIIASVIASPFGIFISDEAADPNSIPVSSIIAECNMELSAKLTEIEDNTPHHRCVVEGERVDWKLVLSVFAVKLAVTDDNTAQDVVVIDEAKKEKLKTVFWDMHTITSRTEVETVGELTQIVLYITISAKTKDEMIAEYHFGAKQKEALETLLENGDAFAGTMHSLAVSDVTAKKVIENMPEDLSKERKLIVKKACSLVGKVTYFWGGKSSCIGWDSEWGKMKTVTAAGSVITGKTRPFGLDCSGFVTWVFINAGFSESYIGHGVGNQAAKGVRITWDETEPGDLAVYSDNSHIGIIAGRDENGSLLVIHCNAGANNVVITNEEGFGYFVRVVG